MIAGRGCELKTVGNFLPREATTEHPDGESFSSDANAKLLGLLLVVALPVAGVVKMDLQVQLGSRDGVVSERCAGKLPRLLHCDLTCMQIVDVGIKCWQNYIPRSVTCQGG